MAGAAAAAKTTPTMATFNGGPSILPTANPTSESNLTKVPSRPTYATLTRPTNDDIIVLDSIEGIKNDDYLDALEQIIDINLVKGISKTSGKRVQIVLANQAVAKEICTKKIIVKGHVFSPRPLITGSIRAVISYVSLVIPNEAISDALEKIKGIKIVSNIRPLRASLGKPGRTHIMSYRREFHVREEDANDLPDKLQIVYQGTPYWTYITTNTSTCFECKQIGHIVGNCPLANNRNRTDYTHIISESSHAPQSDNNDNDDNNINMNLDFPPIKSSGAHHDKRPLSISSNEAAQGNTTSNEIREPIITDDQEFNTQKPIQSQSGSLPKDKTKSASKRRKTRSSISEEESTPTSAIIEEVVPLARDLFKENSTNLNINYDEFIRTLVYLDTCKGPIALSDSLLKNSTEICEIIDALHQKIKGSKSRAKLTRLKSKIQINVLDSSMADISGTESDKDPRRSIKERTRRESL